MGYGLSSHLSSHIMSRLFNKQTVINIMNKRSLVPASIVGKKVKLTVQGNGTLLPVFTKEGEPVMSVVDEGVQMEKYVYNVQANSGLALSNARNKEYSAQGVAAEKAGDFQAAHDFFVQYLNATQISFNVPSTNAINAKLSQGVDIAAKIVRIDTEAGSLLTIDPSTISIVEPEELKATVFSFDEETEPEGEAKPEGEGQTAGELSGALKA